MLLYAHRDTNKPQHPQQPGVARALDFGGIDLRSLRGITVGPARWP